MNKNSTIKKRVVVSFHNLPVELQEEVKKKYPTGYTENMIRVDRGQGDFFYAVVFETDDISYLIKVDVKVDDKIEEEEDKEYYDDDDIKGADEIIDNGDDSDDSDDSNE